MFYKKEKNPDYIKHIKDTLENRKILEEKLGKPKFCFDNFSYIEINTKENRWRSCLDYEWLYRNQPNLMTIEEFLSTYQTS